MTQVTLCKLGEFLGRSNAPTTRAIITCELSQQRPLGVGPDFNCHCLQELSSTERPSKTAANRSPQANVPSGSPGTASVSVLERLGVLISPIGSL